MVKYTAHLYGEVQQPFPAPLAINGESPKDDFVNCPADKKSGSHTEAHAQHSGPGLEGGSVGSLGLVMIIRPRLDQASCERGKEGSVNHWLRGQRPLRGQTFHNGIINKSSEKMGGGDVPTTAPEVGERGCHPWVVERG